MKHEALEAENERLTRERDEAVSLHDDALRQVVLHVEARTKAEAERDAARAESERLRETVRKREREHLAACAELDEARADKRAELERVRDIACRKVRAIDPTALEDKRAAMERVRALFHEHIKRDDEEERAFLDALSALEDKP